MVIVARVLRRWDLACGPQPVGAPDWHAIEAGRSEVHSGAAQDADLSAVGGGGTDGIWRALMKSIQRRRLDA